MSISNGQPEATEGQQQAARGGLFANIKSYITSLGLDASHLLTQHAANHHHEDVPADVVKEPEAVLSAAVTAESLRTSIPVPDSNAPGRLRSLFPPANYGAVVPGNVYRSSYPQGKNYEFLKSLKLKTIITLVPEEISPEYREFMRSAGIQHFQVHINANKGGVRVQSCDMSRALNVVLDRSNHPILIHCNKGKHRTGCVVGLLRRIQGYDIELIREEYHTYADPKARFLDEVFFEHFDLNTVMWLARQENWALPSSELAPPSPPPSPVSALSVARPRA
ncbi:tyrosine-protein phosphatase SIW14 [Trematosphaeria pertusa]|uniref:Tyrosine-protein phosphatase SIW14 n=1 Tax=Trematosphaeria pertusa TaxID=390896 RepID=A0A6A6J0K6_9PLEO|nr:tyrosine-protein phosphatase SIW14 [Trematosphaeria pertusa]KAF2256264.1 tyrosine-protein phosphatase SIW14 [Trematosphaeria pertusa]